MNEQQLFILRHNYLEKCLNKGTSLSPINTQTMIIYIRMTARRAIERYNAIKDERLKWSREKSKLERQGIRFLYLDNKLKDAEDREKQAYEEQADYGEMFFHLLTLWQAQGATLKDLCELCNANYNRALKHIPQDMQDDIVKVAMVCNIDYQSNGSGWIDTKCDGPLTHCLNAFFCERILDNPEYKEIVNQAVQEHFPEFYENAFTIQKDEYGNLHCYDMDGYEIDRSEIDRSEIDRSEE